MKETPERHPNAERAILVFTAVIGFIISYKLLEAGLFDKYFGVELPNNAMTVISVLSAPIYVTLMSFLVGPLVRLCIRLYERFSRAILKNASVESLLCGLIGILVGLCIASFLREPLRDLGEWGKLLVIPVYVVCALACMLIFQQIDTDYLANIRLGRRVDEELEARKDLGPKIKVLDTSALIDGRILDVARCGFIEGELLLPNFMLEELRLIADSPDDQKRTRGRWGMQVAKSLREDERLTVHVTDTDYSELKDVDDKLLRLCRDIHGVLVTTDYNLSRIAGISGVTVLNVNELASVLRAHLLPGEVITLMVQKVGREAGQGVGYLEDGTMVILENGRDRIGSLVSASVTGITQTASGRLIFARVI